MHFQKMDGHRNENAETDIKVIAFVGHTGGRRVFCLYGVSDISHEKKTD